MEPAVSPKAGTTKKQGHPPRRDFGLFAGAVCVFGSIILTPALWMIGDYKLATVPRFVFLSLELLFGAGVLVMVISSITVRLKKYSCRACGKGELFPIASEVDGTEYGNTYTASGHVDERKFTKKTVSQYYDCDRCSHRVWIEHNDKPRVFTRVRDEQVNSHS